MPARMIILSSLRTLWALRTVLADMAAPFAVALAWWLTALALPPEQRGTGTLLAALTTLWLALPLVVNIHRLLDGTTDQPLPTRALVRLGRAEVLVAIALVLIVAPVAFALALLFIAVVTGSAIGVLIALPEVVLLVAAALRVFPAVAAGAQGQWPPWRIAWGLSALHLWPVIRTVAAALGLVVVMGYALSIGLSALEAWLAAPAAGRSQPPLAGVLVLSVLEATAATVAAAFLSIVSAMLFAAVQAPSPLPTAPHHQPGGGRP